MTLVSIITTLIYLRLYGSIDLGEENWKCRQIHGIEQRSEAWMRAQSSESSKRHTEFNAGQSLDQTSWTKMMKCTTGQSANRLIVQVDVGLVWEI